MRTFMGRTLARIQILKVEDKKMLVGFSCPKSGRNEPFSFCWSKCQVHCKPLPVLLALAHQDRGLEENVYHVTEILSPPQQVYLKRNNPYYMKPDSLIDMNIGSSWHSKLEETKKYVKELGLQDDYLMEQNFKERFCNVCFNKEDKEIKEFTILSGTSDLYVKSTKTLFDYKVMKYFYTFKYLSEQKWEGSTIPMQLNIYRVYQYPKAEEIKIFVYLKDYKLNFSEKYDLDPTEMLHVPMIPDDKVKKKVVELLTEHVTAQKTGKPRACTEEEKWINREGIPLRCEYYCAVNQICPDYRPQEEK